MTDPLYAAEFATWARNLNMSKRARQCLEHLLEFGTLSTEQLSEMGYEHPPRAIRDLRDAGAVVKTGSTKNRHGKRIAEYTLVSDQSTTRSGRLGIPKKFRDEVNASTNFHCAVCSASFEGRELQCDHRVPFEIAGDPDGFVLHEWMPLCASCNRSKSWSCEHCPNWTVRDANTCKTCFWASPESYKHVATLNERRINLTFQGAEQSALADAVIAESNGTGRSAQQVAIDALFRQFGLPKSS